MRRGLSWQQSTYRKIPVRIRQEACRTSYVGSQSKERFMSTADDFFIANGPGLNGFQTNGPNTKFGAFLEGSEIGLFSVTSDDPLGNIRALRTGVWAKGDDVGVYGQTRIKGPPTTLSARPLVCSEHQTPTRASLAPRAIRSACSANWGTVQPCHSNGRRYSRRLPRPPPSLLLLTAVQPYSPNLVRRRTWRPKPLTLHSSPLRLGRQPMTIVSACSEFRSDGLASPVGPLQLMGCRGSPSRRHVRRA
jgi:hypothetical protein